MTSWKAPVNLFDFNNMHCSFATSILKNKSLVKFSDLAHPAAWKQIYLVGVLFHLREDDNLPILGSVSPEELHGKLKKAEFICLFNSAEFVQIQWER